MVKGKEVPNREVSYKGGGPGLVGRQGQGHDEGALIFSGDVQGRRRKGTGKAKGLAGVEKRG